MVLLENISWSQEYGVIADLALISEPLCTTKRSGLLLPPAPWNRQLKNEIKIKPPPKPAAVLEPERTNSVAPCAATGFHPLAVQQSAALLQTA